MNPLIKRQKTIPPKKQFSTGQWAVGVSGIISLSGPAPDIVPDICLVKLTTIQTFLLDLLNSVRECRFGWPSVTVCEEMRKRSGEQNTMSYHSSNAKTKPIPSPFQLFAQLGGPFDVINRSRQKFTSFQLLTLGRVVPTTTEIKELKMTGKSAAEPEVLRREASTSELLNRNVLIWEI